MTTHDLAKKLLSRPPVEALAQGEEQAVTLEMLIKQRTELVRALDETRTLIESYNRVIEYESHRPVPAPIVPAPKSSPKPRKKSKKKGVKVGNINGEAAGTSGIPTIRAMLLEAHKATGSSLTSELLDWIVNAYPGAKRASMYGSVSKMRAAGELG